MKVRAVGAFVIFLVILTSPFIVNAAQGHLGSAAQKPELSDNCVKDDEPGTDEQHNCLERPTTQVERDSSGVVVSQKPLLDQVCAIKDDNGVYTKDYVVTNHQSILITERTNAVRLGVRDQDHSLKNCFTCHQDKTTFCDRCHNYSGVQPTCFNQTGGCHNDKGEV